MQSIRICRDCGQTYELSDGQIRFFAQRDLPLPKRCEPCRAIRRYARTQMVNEAASARPHTEAR